MSIKKNIATLYLTQIASIGIAFLSSICLARILGPAGRGEQAIFSNAITFATLFFGFSIQSTMTYFLNAGKMPAEKLLLTLGLFACLSAIALGLTLFVLKQQHLLHLALPPAFHSFRWLLVFVLAYVCTLGTSILNALLLSRSKYRQQNLLFLLPACGFLILYVLIYRQLISGNAWRDFHLVILAFLITAFCNMLIVGALCIPLLKRSAPWGLLSGTELRNLFRYAFYSFAANVAQFFSYRLDIWMVDKFCGKAELGIYAQGVMLLQMLWILPNALGTILYTSASEKPLAEVHEKIVKMIRLSLYATLGTGLLFLLLSWYFVPVLFGQAFAPSFYVIAWMLGGYILFSIPSTASSLFSAYGRFRVNFMISTGVAVCSAGLYYFMTRAWGISGAALASDLSYLLSTVLTLILLRRFYGIRLLDVLDIRHDFHEYRIWLLNRFRTGG